MPTTSTSTLELSESPVPRWTYIAAGAALAAAGLRRSPLSAALLCGVGGALLYRSLSGSSDARLAPFARGTRLRTSILVKASSLACYRRWRRLEDLPEFLDYIDRVEVLSEKRSVWVTKPIAGRSLRWEAEITRDVPGEIIGWRSMPGSAVTSSGSIRFEKRDGGTLITITMKYGATGDLLGDTLIAVLGKDPERQMESMLWRFKDEVEFQTVAVGESFSDPVDEALDESFPASDPPAWTPG